MNDALLMEFERANVLLEHLGGLLPSDRRETMQLYYAEDMSLAEIAEELSISRQAVHARIRQDLRLLEDAELRLGIVKMHRELADLTRRLAATMQDTDEEQRGILRALETLARTPAGRL